MSAVLTTAVTAVTSMAENAATGQDHWPGPLEEVRRHAWPVLAVGLAVAFVIALRSLRPSSVPAGFPDDPPPPTAPTVPEWVVDRDQVDQVVAALRQERRSATVGITAAAALHGAGGFGKTTVAELVWSDRRVQRRFGGRIYRVVLGRDVRSRAEVAAKVCEAARFITGDATVFEDPELAGAHLDRLLRVRPPTLLIIDDVWWPEQIRPFMTGDAGQCVRLVTTRVPDLLPQGAQCVLVDEMSPRQAESLLTRDIDPPWPPDILQGLLDVTGRWPLLLRLVNRLAARRIATGADPTAVAAEIMEQLRRSGPAAVDDPTLSVELDDPRQRNKAVRATIEAAALLLPPGGYERFTELGVFAEDEYVPVSLVAGLWRVTASLSESATRDLCTVLARMSLVHLDPGGGGRLKLHDVIREFLRARLGGESLQRLNSVLIETAARTVPAADPRPGDGAGPEYAWWHISDRYLIDHLTAHLSEAGQEEQVTALVTDLRWIEWRLDHGGVAGVVSDYDHAGGHGARSPGEYLSATAHLLGPTTPAHARASVLRARLGAYAPWREQALAWQSSHPVLRPRWALPDVDQPDPNRRTIQRPAAYRDRLVRQVAISPDTTRVAAVYGAGDVCVWDPADGQVISVHSAEGTESVRTVALCADSVRIATVEGIDRVRVRNPHTGEVLNLLPGASGGLVRAAAFSRGLSHLATVHGRGTVHVWDLAGNQLLHSFTPGVGVDTVALAADASTLATADHSGTVRIWDLEGHRATRTLTDGGGPGIQALACSRRDGQVGISAFDGTVNLWDAATGEALGVPGAPARLRAAAFTPDVTALLYVDVRGACGLLRLNTVPSDTRQGSAGAVEGEDDKGVETIAVTRDGAQLIVGRRLGSHQIRDIDTGRVERRWQHDTIIGFRPVLSPDGATAASLDGAGNVRLRHFYGHHEGPNLNTLMGPVISTRKPVRLLALSAGTKALALVDEVDAVQIWDVHSHTLLRSLNARNVTSGNFSRDGKQLATADRHGTIRIWGARSGDAVRYLTTDPDRGEVNGLSFSDNGAWIAAVQSRGTVRVWDFDDDLITEMRTNGSLAACRWFDDDRALAVGGSRGLYVFDFEAGVRQFHQ
ncbi:NB-ARC domain-containing protein [Streptomyces sp. NPDC059740]|uniref:NB-ARC domain-containing protein n=1 Tax=Streptomyces sp. NPDC059740 TaxID=3346926 RepID=UPI003658EC81